MGREILLAVRPETSVAIADAGGTLRDKLFGHARLAAPRPATTYWQPATGTAAR